MAVVIRLQGLSAAAGSQDIRKFFSGLRIPDGGVHIVGGDLEEAFILFGSDEDARIAMIKSGDYIQGAPVKLLLSSKTELQNVLERSSVNLLMKEKPRPLKMEGQRGSRRSSGKLGYSPPRHRRDTGMESERQLLLRGMPFAVTEKDVFKFFDGLAVDKVVLMKNNRGQNNGNGLVTFALKEDVNRGLQRHKGYIGTRFVEVYTLKEWHKVFGEMPPGMALPVVSERRHQSPPRHQDTYRIRSRSPLAHGSSPSSGEYCVLLDNLSYAAEKLDIMKFFATARLGSDEILYLLDGNGLKTRRAFVLFKNLQDYRDALDCDNQIMIDRNVSVRPISREKMLRLLQDQKINPPSDQNGIHVKFLPLDVRKVEVKDFFADLNVIEDDIILLRDRKGAGLGEAIVLFQSGAEAMEALNLNGTRFLGSQVRLRGVSQSQMQELINPPVAPKSLSRGDRYSGRNINASSSTEVDVFSKRSARGDRPRTSRDTARGSHNEPRGSHNDAREGTRGGAKLSGQDDPKMSGQNGPTCIKLVNIPFKTQIEEVYDFCYGYRVIPGSISMQYDKAGSPKGTATVVFETRQEAIRAIDELTGRPIGERNIHLVFL
ncbi:unnamed protein product [Knipowitschia caucasica]